MTEETKRIVTTLHPDQFRKLRERSMGGVHGCRVIPETTPLQAGFQLGMQHVLNLLEEGFVTTAP